MTMFIIIRTGSGRKYARRIGQELKRLDSRNKWLIPSVNYFPESFRNRPWLTPENTIIHSRAAYPDALWMRNLVSKEEEGFRVINKTNVLKLTSDKLECSLKMLGAGLQHPKTWEARRDIVSEAERDILNAALNPTLTKVVVKPYTSMEQGENVKVVELSHNCICPHCENSHNNTTGRIMTVGELRSVIAQQPTDKIIIQEFVEYDAIYRIIVIGGRALPFSFVDKPTRNRWKVSVCLNREMQFVCPVNPNLLRLAQETQQVIGGEINFIDIFHTTQREYVLSEINTACNLSIHEEKAKQAGHPKWNIAKEIAKYLYEEARRI